MRNSGSVRFAVRMGMMLALLGAALAGRAAGDPGEDGAEKSSEKGLSPNASITSVSGLQIDTYRMNLMFNVPLTPSFKVADGISYGVTARYSSNIFSNDSSYHEVPVLGGTPPFSHIPTLKSPFGAGYEFGFGIIYLDYQSKLNGDSGDIESYHRQFVLQTPDGSSHQLHLLATQASDISHLVGGEPMGGHLKGDAYVVQSAANGPWTEHFNPNAEYYTADGSMIRAKYHQETSIFGSPAFWEIFYPDGRRVLYTKPFNPEQDGIQGKYLKSCTAASGPNKKANLNTDYPQEMLGWYPTRVENARGVGFRIFYEDAAYPYLVTRINDDTDRKNFGSADILFTIGTSGIEAGRYTDISYPGTNGTRQNVHLTYITQAAHYTAAGGDPIIPAYYPSLDPEAFSSLNLTLLHQVQMPGSYVQTFTYFDETGTGDALKASGRVKRIDLPTGGVHLFQYRRYEFQTSSETTDSAFGLGIASHILKVRDFATTAPDKMEWNYRQATDTVSCNNNTCYYDVLNTVTDPAGNETVYRFNGQRQVTGSIFTGTLAQTEFFQGTVTGGVLKKRVVNGWDKFNVSYNNAGAQYRDPMKPQIVTTVTQFWDDPINSTAANILVEENLGWDYWGHFTIKRTSGTLVPRARQTVTAYSIDRDTLGLTSEPLVDGTYAAIGKDRVSLLNSCSISSAGGLPPATLPRIAHWTVNSCAYLAGALTNWRPSLPLSVELQEFDGVNWVTKTRAETRYDLATGLPTRTIARKTPAGAATSACDAAIVPQPGDVVSDFYYDDRGNITLKKVYGADDASVFRSYMGTGDKPGSQDDPAITGLPATIFPPGANENIYSNAGGYFGFDRWSREFSAADTAPHRFVNSFVDTADLEPVSGAFIFSHDANGMSSKTEYDSIGRVSRKTFLGDGSLNASDKPVDYAYVDVDVGGGVKQLVSLKSVQEDTTPGNENQRIETQDYYDGLGRKVISRRLNPDGQFAYQVMHYDEIGHADLVSNWSFFPPPGVDFDGGVLDAGLWTDGPLKAYILSTVGAYTRSCYRPGCGSGAGTYEFAGRPLRTERIAQQGAELISRVDTQYFGFNTKVTTYGLNSATATGPGTITTHYTDGYGNLRVVDADEQPANAAGLGADAIYDYDYANRLIKVNLVAEAAFIPVSVNNQDRYATSNGDGQIRLFSFDSLGRQTQAQNVENGITKYLTFNALGQVLEAEDANGRSGGGPGGGIFDETPQTPITRACGIGNQNQCIPLIKIAGISAGGGEMYTQWTGEGKDGFDQVHSAALYYRVFIDGVAVTGWVLGMQSYATTGLFSSKHSLTVVAAYEPEGQTQGSEQQTFTNQNSDQAYHLKHAYDSRGRETAVVKVLISGEKSTLRQFDYDVASGSAATDCAPSRSCGKLVQAVAKRVGTGNVTQSFAFRSQDGRMDSQRLGAPHVNRPVSELAFDYDNFGRQDLAAYPDGRQIKLIFQSGGVKSVNKVDGEALTPYAEMGRPGDYHSDGSLAAFLQGNGLTFHRYLDGAERVNRICYNTFPTTTDLLAPCHDGTGVPDLWDSGGFLYDGVGNIRAIGNDAFSHDRLNRLMTATINRHPRGAQTFQEAFSQPAGTVNMIYNYDVYGNITQRYQSNTGAGDPYRAGSDIERFGAVTPRDYQNGPTAPDNKIHDPDGKFLYDGNGNMVSDGLKDFIYDELSQQIEVREAVTTCAAALGNGNPHTNKGQIQNANPNSGIEPANIACYGAGNLIEANIYGPDGMRAVRQVMRATDGTTVNKQTVYVRLASNVVKEYTEEYETVSSSLPTISKEKAYIYGPLGLLATEEICNFKCDATDTAGANTTRYYEYDHLGTVRAITKGDGTLESTFDYEPFGLELKGTQVSFTDFSSNTHRFTGHERDEEAGEDYMKARMYVLSTARFPQIDPMFGGAGNPQNWNAYIYVGNSPVGASDPTGMVEVIVSGVSLSGSSPMYQNLAGYYDSGLPAAGKNPVLLPGIAIFANTHGVTFAQALNMMSHGVTSVMTITPANQSGGISSSYGAAPLPPPVAGTPGSPFQGPPAPIINSVTILGKTIPISYGNTISQSDKITSGWGLKAASDLINKNAKKLTPAEKSIIGNVMSITVDTNKHSGVVDVELGIINFWPDYISDSSAAWMASVIGHEGNHIQDYMERKPYNRETAAAREQEADTFQIQIGIKFGLSKTDIQSLNDDINGKTHTAYDWYQY